MLNTSTGYLATLVPTVINTLSASYPELLEKERYIQDIINEEEKSFSVLLPRGVKYIHELLENEEPTNTSKTISGEHAFYLYDTLGFPIDLTQLILEEKGYKVNMNEFESLMSAQKAKSREKPKSLGNESEFSSMKLGIEQIAYLQKAEVPPTNDEWKYFTSIPVEFSAKIKALVNSSGEIIVNPSIVPLHLHGNFGVILDNTPFYSESGGQISDIGTLEISSFDGRSHVLKVVDVQSCGPYVIHTCVFPSHEIASSDIFSCDSVTCSVDYVRRSAISANHTMTHLLNFALREVLSPNSVSPIDQKGSLVSDDKLRFDFSYSKSLTKTEIEEIERRLNNIIQQSLKVSSDFTSLRQITDINGVRAVFGENYPDPVRVVSIGSTLADILANPSRTEWLKLSIELCGGIHLENTADAILFRIIEESSSARGVRRITAVTGDRALETQSNAQRLNQLLTNYQKDLNLTIDANLLSTYTNKLTEFQNLLASQPIPYLDRLEMTNKSNELKKQLQNLTKQYITRDIDKKVKSLALQGKYALEQKLNFEIFILSPNKETPSDEALKQQNAIYQISDSIHIKRITNELNEQFENRLSYLLVIEEEDKITCVSSLQPNAIEKGLSASHWIESLMKSFHGKGGGKQNLANGSLKYDRQSHPFLIDQILGHANELMAQYEMKMNE